MSKHKEKQCTNCYSKTTYTSPKKHLGYICHDWRKDEKGNILCKRCWSNLVDNPKRNPERHKKYNPRRLKFKNDIVLISNDFRTYVCNLCRAVYPWDCKRIGFHHEKYITDKPLESALEVCSRCHSHLTWELGQHSGIRLY